MFYEMDLDNPDLHNVCNKAPSWCVEAHWCAQLGFMHAKKFLSSAHSPVTFRLEVVSSENSHVLHNYYQLQVLQLESTHLYI